MLQHVVAIFFFYIVVLYVYDSVFRIKKIRVIYIFYVKLRHDMLLCCPGIFHYKMEKGCWMFFLVIL